MEYSKEDLIEAKRQILGGRENMGTEVYYNRKAKVLQHYKNKSLYHFGKDRYIIVEATTIRNYGG